MSSVGTDGEDGRGLKLEKNFANQARFNALPAKLPRKLLWSVLLYRSILCLGRGTKEAQSVIFAMTFFFTIKSRIHFLFSFTIKFGNPQ